MGNQIATEKQHSAEKPRTSPTRRKVENGSSEGQTQTQTPPSETSSLLERAAAGDVSPPLHSSSSNSRQQRQQVCLPLSTRLMGSLAGGIYCHECRTRNLSETLNLNGTNSGGGSGESSNTTTASFRQHYLHHDRGPNTSHMNGEHIRQAADDDNNNDEVFHDYDLQELARQNSQVISPLVLAPMLQPLEPTAGKMATVERIMTEYMTACQFYGCGKRVNAGVLTTLRFSLPSLRVTGDFHDADMLALAEVLLRHGNGPLRFIKRLDFSRSSREGKLHGKTGFSSHGALTLSKILQQSEYIEEVRLEGNRLGPYGASALFVACSNNRYLKRLMMRRCLIGERGGLAFAELLARCKEACGLVDVDLSVNRIGFRGSLEIEKALMKRINNGYDSIYVDLEGNLVLQEIMNGCTHGLGIILAIVGAVLLSQRVRGMGPRHVISCAVYSASLLMLYTSSTLYHSFFALQNTRYIFEVLDKCAIYILIAGSYTPFITIIVASHFQLQVAMLLFIWLGCFLGIYVEFYHPTWKHKTVFSLSMYLGIGWVAAFVPRDVVAIVPQGAINLIVLGGVGYTSGVPFFLRNNFLDHSIWHLFVLTASIFHWAAVYFYIVYMD